MSEIKVSQMPEANNINDNDLLMIIQGGYNKKISKELLGIPSKAHQVNVSTEVDNTYKVNLLKTKNLFDVSTLQRNKWLNINGTISESSDPNIVSAFIKVNNGKQYIFSGIPSTFTLRVCSYTNTSTNSFKTCLINNVNNIKTFTADADYIVFTIGSGDATTLNEIQLEEGSTATEYTPFINNQINVDNEKYSDTINVGATEDSRSRVNVLKSKNLFDKNDVINAYLNSNGTPIANNDLRVSNYIDIEGASTIAISGSQGNGVVSCFYNSSKTPTGDYFSLSSSQTTKIVAVPSNAKYIRITINSSALDTYQLEKGDTITAYEPYIVPSIKVDNEEIYNKALSDYSTNEQRIGTWLGKPLYRKAIDCGALPNNAQKNINHNIANIGDIINIKGYSKAINGNIFPVPFPALTAAGNISVFVNATAVAISTGTDRTSFTTTYVILEYTKTTD